MAIDIIEPWWEQRQGSEAMDLAVTASRSWLIMTDDGEDGVDVLMDSNLLPAIGASWSAEHDDWRASSRRFTQDPIDPRKWSVVIEYTNRGLPSEKPLDVLWATVERRVPLIKDLAGELIATSAGEAFDPPGEDEETDIQLTITKNILAPDWAPATTMAYRNKVNSEVFRGFGVGKVLLRKITAKELVDGTTDYVAVTYEFMINEKGWLHKPLDAGFLQAGKKKIMIEGREVTKPWPLDGAGAPLPKDFDPLTDPVYLEFEIKGQADFGDLDLE